MGNKIVLVSDDTNFFDYLRERLCLRKSDELFTFKFDDIPEKLHLLTSALIIVNSEDKQEKAFSLLKIFNNTPVIITAFNDDSEFKQKCYDAGAFDYITLLTPEAEFQARLTPAFAVVGLLQKNNQYRDILINKNIITENNEVFVDYNFIIDKELKEIHSDLKKAIFVAISPNDKSKFLLSSNKIETIILNNIRKNDILMNYAANKYFLFLFDIDIIAAQKLLSKIFSQIPEKIYAGFSVVTNQKRQQLINEALNKLHEAINYDKEVVESRNIEPSSIEKLQRQTSPYANFKLFKQEFGKKVEQVISPVFYQLQQKYTGKMSGVIMQQETGDGYGIFYIKGNNLTTSFKVSSPGFAKINIDITYQKDNTNIDTKRISLEPEEFEAGLLNDLLEQFILDYKRSENND